MIARSEDAVKLLGPSRDANPVLVAEVLTDYPLDIDVLYEGARVGTVTDVSKCGLWLLLVRRDIQGNERARIAVLVSEVKAA